MTEKPKLIVMAGSCRPGADRDPHARAADLAQLSGDSAGAGQDVAAARRRGLPASHDVSEIPRLTRQGAA
ncbi:hypothetical protein [Streptomyces sp. JH34]|uniref:hypothetical protein n=1 Tax=unclassified Streptomyces TaxID=2593676 RepID=UPI0023F627EF|nr:hypothetical protein [Streptomyces sp. JH34]MDF6021394.1 hypothetical protein [Streptomyces sp. JH34]